MIKLSAAKQPQFRNFFKSTNHLEVMISMGIPPEMIEDIQRDEFHGKLTAFMENYGIPEEERSMVVDFYNKVYANFRAQQPNGGQINRRDPELWELRKSFLKKCGVGVNTRRKSYNIPKVVWYMRDHCNFCWLDFNMEDLDDEPLAYLVTNAALHVANEKASERTFDYMWDEMEDSTLYDIYKRVKEFEKSNVALA